MVFLREKNSFFQQKLKKMGFFRVFCEKYENGWKMSRKMLKIYKNNQFFYIFDVFSHVFHGSVIDFAGAVLSQHVIPDAFRILIIIKISKIQEKLLIFLLDLGQEDFPFVLGGTQEGKAIIEVRNQLFPL